MKNKEILIVGGGFAGVQAAIAASKRASVAHIRLIDANGHATMVPALPDIVSGRIAPNALARPLREVLPERVALTIDKVSAVDPTNRVVTGAEGSYSYDSLVIASGSKPNYYGFTPDGGTLHSVHSLPAARAFRDAFIDKARSNSQPEVIVVGGGYTGLEVAACLRYGAEQAGVNPRIRVVELAGEILAFLPERPRLRLTSYLEEQRVEVLTSTSLAALTEERAELSNGEQISDPVVCWSAGMQAELGDITGSVERARDGRIQVNDALQIPAHPDVFVAGDAANLQKDGAPLRRAVNFSFYSGRRAGENAAALVNGEKLRGFTPVDLGWVIPLSGASTGRLLGAIPVGGTFGLRLHYFMCGLRHFGSDERGEFYKTAGYLKRNPGLLEVAK